MRKLHKFNDTQSKGQIWNTDNTFFWIQYPTKQERNERPNT